MQPLLAELQRRRVPRILGVYMAAAFALSQGIQLIEDALHLPGWVLTAVVIAALLGFPLVALFAWFFDFREGALVRTAPAPRREFRWSATYAVAVALVFSALLLAGWVALKPRDDASGKVAVIPLQDRTNDAQFASLGEIAADWITEALLRAGITEVMDVQTTLRAGVTGVPTANTIVTGNYYRVGDRLLFNVKITTANGRTIQALQPIEGPAAEPTAALDELRERVVAAIALSTDRRVSGFEGSAGPAPSYPAYESYVEALHAYLAGNHHKAAPLFVRAVELDSTFLRAKLWAAVSTAFIGNEPLAQQYFNALLARQHELSAYDRHHLHFFIGFLSGDFERAYSEARGMMAAAPASEDALRETALSALRVGRVSEAIELFERLRRSTSIADQWDEYYQVLVAAYRAIGQPKKATELAREGRARFRSSYTLAAVADAAVANNDSRSAVALADTILRGEVSGPVDTAHDIAVALNAAGRTSEAAAIWRRLATDGTADDWDRFVYSYYIGDPEDVRAAARAVPAGFRRDIAQGAVAAHDGNVAEARKRLDALRSVDHRVARLWRARIFARLGEKDSAVATVGTMWVSPETNAPMYMDPGLLSLRGYPPFDQRMRAR